MARPARVRTGSYKPNGAHFDTFGGVRYADPTGRFDLFRSRLAHLFATKLQDTDQIILSDLVEMINEGLDTDSLFSTDETTAACKTMEAQEELFMSGEVVYKI